MKIRLSLVWDWLTTYKNVITEVIFALFLVAAITTLLVTIEFGKQNKLNSSTVKVLCIIDIILGLVWWIWVWIKKRL